MCTLTCFWELTKALSNLVANKELRHLTTASLLHHQQALSILVTKGSLFIFYPKRFKEQEQEETEQRKQQKQHAHLQLFPLISCKDRFQKG